MGRPKTLEVIVARLARAGAISAEEERLALAEWWRTTRSIVLPAEYRKQLRTLTSSAHLHRAATHLNIARIACASDVQSELAAAIVNERNADPNKQTSGQKDAADAEVRKFFSDFDRVIGLLKRQAKFKESYFAGVRPPSIDKFFKREVLQRIEDFWTGDLSRPRNTKLVDFAGAVLDELDMPYKRSSLQRLLPAKKRIPKSQG
ncbi:MAG: hypothetical protein WAN43_11740 [Rhodomicrobium sp.]